MGFGISEFREKEETKKKKKLRFLSYPVSGEGSGRLGLKMIIKPFSNPVSLSCSVIGLDWCANFFFGLLSRGPSRHEAAWGSLNINFKLILMYGEFCIFGFVDFQ